MPLIASGASAAISIPKGYLLALMAGAYGAVAFGAGPASRQAPVVLVGQAVALGPYPDTQAALVTSQSGQLAYSLLRADGLVASKVPNSPFQLSPLILEQNNVTGTALTGTTVQTTLASILIPAGLIGLNGSLRMRAVASTTNNANSKSINFLLGGTALAGGAAVSNIANVASNLMSNRGSLASQLNTSPVSNGATGTFTTTAVNTAIDQILTITGTLAVGTDTMALESYLIEVLPG